MSGRIEYKYLVPNTLLPAIRAELRPFMQVDAFAEKQGSTEYTVRSVYFDTPHMDCYHEKQDGLNARRKFRIRGYNRPDGNSIVFLEIKRKNGPFIEKHRAALLYKDLNGFFDVPDTGNKIVVLSDEEKEQADAGRFLYHYYRRGLRPAVLVVYDREPFFGRMDTSLRITFDKNLRTVVFPSLDMLFEDERLEFAMPQHFILEVKFFRRALPSWVAQMVKRYELPRMALSKFTICLDSQGAQPRALQMKSMSASVWGSV